MAMMSGQADYGKRYISERRFATNLSRTDILGKSA